MMLGAAFTVEMASMRPSVEPFLLQLCVMVVMGPGHTASEKFPQEDPRGSDLHGARGHGIGCPSILARKSPPSRALCVGFHLTATVPPVEDLHSWTPSLALWRLSFLK